MLPKCLVSIPSQTTTISRVDVQFEMTPNNPDSILHMTNIHVLRWRALLALECDLQQPPRDSVALMESVLTWSLTTPPPPLIGNTVSYGRIHPNLPYSRGSRCLRNEAGDPSNNITRCQWSGRSENDNN